MYLFNLVILLKRTTTSSASENTEKCKETTNRQEY